MSGKSIGLSDDLHGYLLAHTAPEPDVMARLRAETARLPQANMQIAPEQASFMAFLVELIGARRCLEIGTFTGYSALAVALALPAEGRLVACDVSKEWTDIARRYWDEAGVADRIDLRLGPALETLDALLAESGGGTFDFAFVDAAKTEYVGYYERIYRLLRSGGVALFDNVLWDGRVAEPQVDDDDTRGVRALNDRLAGDDRVTIAMIPLADGLTLVRKR